MDSVEGRIFSNFTDKIEDRPLARDGKKLLEIPQNDFHISQKVKDFVADSKKIPQLFDRQPLARAESTMSRLGCIGCFVGGGALLALGAAGIIAAVGGVVAGGLLLPTPLLVLLGPIVMAAAIALGISSLAIAGGVACVVNAAGHALARGDPERVSTRPLNNELFNWEGRANTPTTKEGLEEAYNLYKTGHMSAFSSTLSDEVFVLNIRQTPGLSPKDKEITIQQYLDHKKAATRLIPTLQFQASLDRAQQFNERRKESLFLMHYLNSFWVAQPKQLLAMETLKNTIQNANISDADRIRFMGELESTQQSLQIQLSNPPSGDSQAWKNQYDTFTDQLGLLKAKYTDLLDQAQQDALLLKEWKADPDLPQAVREELQNHFLDEREVLFQNASLSSQSNKYVQLRDHYQYLVTQIKVDEEFLRNVRKDPKISDTDRKEFEIRFQNKRQELMNQLAQTNPASWSDPNHEQAFKDTFVTMRTHWEEELQRAENWDWKSEDLIKQFPELSNEKNKDYLEAALDKKNSYFARIGIIEKAIKQVRNIQLESSRELLSRKERIQLESAVTTPWEHLLLVEKAAQQHALQDLVVRTQSLTITQLERILWSDRS